MIAKREAVRRAFGHARDYDAHASVQRQIAATLATRITADVATESLPSPRRILEIGCGTGFLTASLMDAGLRGERLITDIAPEMVERCRQRFGGRSDFSFAVLDGEYGPLPPGPFDLICSSLAVQWFDDAPAALARLARLLTPGGNLFVTTLGPESFAEWRAAHQAEGLDAGMPRFASLDAFAALDPASLTVETVTERHESARAFVRALKAIGAGTPDAAHRPLTPTQMRRVMARFDQSGCEVSYQVVTCHLRGVR